MGSGEGVEGECEGRGRNVDLAAFQSAFSFYPNFNHLSFPPPPPQRRKAAISPR